MKETGANANVDSHQRSFTLRAFVNFINRHGVLLARVFPKLPVARLQNHTVDVGNATRRATAIVCDLDEGRLHRFDPSGAPLSGIVGSALQPAPMRPARWGSVIRETLLAAFPLTVAADVPGYTQEDWLC